MIVPAALATVVVVAMSIAVLVRRPGTRAAMYAIDVLVLATVCTCFWLAWWAPFAISFLVGISCICAGLVGAVRQGWCSTMQLPIGR